MTIARCGAILSAMALLLAMPATASTGWVLDAGTGVATLSHGADGTTGAVRFECAGGKNQFSTWVRKPPRNSTPGGFSSQIRFFQSRNEIAMAATGTVVEGKSVTRLDVALPDAAGVLHGAQANGRLVFVSYAGRTITPAPTSSEIDDFAAACAAHTGH